MGGTWIDARTGEQIISAYYPDHTGLFTVPESPAGRALKQVADNLHPCAFSRSLRVGVCVRQSQTLAPELVKVAGETGRLVVVARPNADYDRIAPLRVEPARWTNRFGQTSDGYVVYPRRFSSRHRYPVIVVTHGDDARNTFADRDLQAEIPVQSLAEHGYVVALVNEPLESLRMHAIQFRQHAVASPKGVSVMQLSVIVEPVASMEAAVASLVRGGVADPRRIGIAGYSRGAEVVMYAMTQSNVFKVASVDDGAPGVNADGYWSFGNRTAPNSYRALYGGSAFSSDVNVLNAYRRFSPDFRASVFAGPLLEQPVEGTAPWAFERLALLRDARVPYDLVFYPNEAHIFWNPRAAAASMERTLDWFNYWLLGEKDSALAKSREYERWDMLRERYRERCPRCLTQLGSSIGSREARDRHSVSAARH
jgi:dipeptidyl aminopeptidase/acylaminoacyl peptidase